MYSDNPPLDSIRESEGMTLRVALGAKPNFGERKSKQIIVNSPILSSSDMKSIMCQDDTPVQVFPTLFEPIYDDCEANEKSLIDKIENLWDLLKPLGTMEVLSSWRFRCL